MNVFFYFCLGFLSIFSSTLYADDDDDRQEANSVSKQPSAPNNPALIFLDQAMQATSGLKTIKLKPAVFHLELLSHGIAVSVEPLSLIKNQYLNALAQQSSAQAKANFSQNSLNRLSYLHHEQIVSTRALQDQQAAWQADKAALDSSHYSSQQIINNARLVWGEKLTDWIINSSPNFTALMQQRTTLLKITIPLAGSSPPALKTIFVAPAGHREQAVVAQLISPAPQTDSFSQGQQFFYQIPATLVKAGMRVSAWIPAQQQAQTGVLIPESAVCWHLGQALVFVKVAEQQFSHRSISTANKSAGGYFISSAIIKAGEEIVSTGAQMLLSQEFRGKIPDEDDD